MAHDLHIMKATPIRGAIWKIKSHKREGEQLKTYFVVLWQIGMAIHMLYLENIYTSFFFLTDFKNTKVNKRILELTMDGWD